MLQRWQTADGGKYAGAVKDAKGGRRKGRELCQECFEMKKSKIANYILILVVILFLVSYPFRDWFVGGMIYSLCCAAVIGGIADWFAVNALFRKPLGIPFKTEIIPRNREKILCALVDMVEDELLPPEVLKQQIGKYEITQNMDSYKLLIKELILRIIRDFICFLNPAELGEMIENFVLTSYRKVKFYSIIKNMVCITAKSGYDNKILDLLIKELTPFFNKKQFTTLLETILTETMNDYEEGKMKRRILNTVVLDSIMGLSPHELAVMVREKMIEYIAELNDAQHPDRIKLKRWILKKVLGLKSNDIVHQEIGRLLKKMDENSAGIAVLTGDYIKVWKDKINNDEVISSKVFLFIDQKMDTFLDSFLGKAETVKYIEQGFRDIMFKWVEGAHKQIGALVYENLNKLKTEELVQMIESKAGDDLQMIRINGSVVGGLLGLAFYLLSDLLQKIFIQ